MSDRKSTCPGQSDGWEFRALWSFLHSLHCMVFTSWSSLHGLPCMVFTSWSSLHGLHFMVFPAWSSLHSLHFMVITSWSSLHGLHFMVFAAWSSLHGLPCMVFTSLSFHPFTRLLGLVRNACLKSDRPEFNSHFRRGSVSRSMYTSDLKIGTPGDRSFGVST